MLRLENYQKINFEDLGLLFRYESEKELGKWFDDDIRVWEDEITNAKEKEQFYDEKTGKNYTLKEVELQGKYAPLRIEFLEINKIDENDYIIDTNYYVYYSDYKTIKIQKLIKWCWENLQFYNNPESWKESYIQDIVNDYQGNTYDKNGKSWSYQEIRNRFLYEDSATAEEERED